MQSKNIDIQIIPLKKGRKMEPPKKQSKNKKLSKGRKKKRKKE